MIYFIQAQQTGHIKIGCTVNLNRRLLQHRGIHGQLTILGVMDGSPADERRLHKRFDEWRTKPGRGIWEWFFDTPTLRDYIAANTHMDTARYFIPTKKQRSIKWSAEHEKLAHQVAQKYAAQMGQSGINTQPRPEKDFNRSGAILYALKVVAGEATEAGEQ